MIYPAIIVPKFVLEAGGTTNVSIGMFTSLELKNLGFKILNLYSHLTGKYGDNALGMGVNWYDFNGNEYSHKRAVMMIRPRK